MVKMRHNQRILGIVGLFFLGALIFWAQFLSTPSTASPDEAANARFSARVADGQSLRIPTTLTAEQLRSFRPRSTAIDGTDVLPGSFTGFVLIHGYLQRFLGQTGSLFFLTLVHLAGLFAWYRIVRRYWEPRWAVLSVAHLVSHPAVWQFLTLPMYHAGLFLSLLIITGLTLVRFQESSTWKRGVIVGLMAGITLFVRPSEILWVAPAIAVIMIARPGGWKKIIATAGVIALVQLPWMMVSQSLFGSFTGSGYTPSGLGEEIAVGGQTLPRWLYLLTPLGGQWSWSFLRHTWDYLVTMFPVYSLLSFVALAAYFRRKLVGWGKWVKIGLLTLIGGYFLAYIGTWELYANVPPSSVGSLSSYARYGLPLLAACTAGVIVFSRSVVRLRFSWVAGIAAVVLVANVHSIFSHPSAGLRSRLAQEREHQAIRTDLLLHTSPDTLIFTGRADTIMMDERLVAYSYPSSVETWQMVKKMTAERPVEFLLEQGGRSVDSWSREALVYGGKVSARLTTQHYVLATLTF